MQTIVSYVNNIFLCAHTGKSSFKGHYALGQASSAQALFFLFFFLKFGDIYILNI